MKRIIRCAIGCILFVCCAARVSLAENGRFGAPTLESFLALSAAERRAFEARVSALSSPSFVTYPAGGSTSSLYTTTNGTNELRVAAGRIEQVMPDYSGLFFIGRSMLGVRAYLSGRQRGLEADGPRLSDIPFSNASGHALSHAERSALREHLARNGLTPREISLRHKPILFLDFVRTGTGSYSLLDEIVRWAKEENCDAAVKRNIHFFGLYSAESIASDALFTIYHQSLREGMQPEKPSPKLVQQYAQTIPLPREDEYRLLTSRVLSTRISSAFYHYAGSHGPTANESFTRNRWQEPINPSEVNSFSSHVGDAAYTELYYLIRMGIQDAQELRERQQQGHLPIPTGCQRELISLSVQSPPPTR